MNKLNQALIVALLLQVGVIALASMRDDGPKTAEPSKVFANFDPEKASKLVIEPPFDD